MPEIKVVNIKCGGCEARIVSELKKSGISVTSVDPSGGIIKFDGDLRTANDTLTRIGYPMEGSVEAKSLMKKARSYISCLIGRASKKSA